MIVVVELLYKKSLADVEEHLSEHRAFLQEYYDKGIFLASGPKSPRDGGIILAVTDIETMKSIVESDPFYVNGVADYRYMTFDPVKHCDALKPLLTGKDA